MAGVDLRTVAELLGHRTLQMAMRYSHLGPDHQVDGVERLVSHTVAERPPNRPSVVLKQMEDSGDYVSLHKG
jgi:hypothetical protein